VYLNAGAHNWRVEYFQGAGGAQLNVVIAPGVVPPPPPPPPPSADVSVDALGPGWTQGGNGAAWRISPNGQGGGSLWAHNNAFIQPLYNWGRWYPQLPQARNYEVFVFIPAGVATTNNARYWVYHAGSYESVAVAQSQYVNQWVSLGTYYFTGQGGENVSLSDVTYECFSCTTIVWDAVKFSPR